MNSVCHTHSISCEWMWCMYCCLVVHNTHTRTWRETRLVLLHSTIWSPCMRSKAAFSQMFSFRQSWSGFWFFYHVVFVCAFLFLRYLLLLRHYFHSHKAVASSIHSVFSFSCFVCVFDYIFFRNGTAHTHTKTFTQSFYLLFCAGIIVGERRDHCMASKSTVLYATWWWWCWLEYFVCQWEWNNASISSNFSLRKSMQTDREKFLLRERVMYVGMRKRTTCFSVNEKHSITPSLLHGHPLWYCLYLWFWFKHSHSSYMWSSPLPDIRWLSPVGKLRSRCSYPLSLISFFSSSF